MMGGRFGKYGDLKRRKALQRGRKEKIKLERTRLTALRSRLDLPSPRSRLSATAEAKTYKTAMVIIPPDHLWGPIQGLRQRHDRHYRRWMPHITLIYPFRPLTAFEQLTPQLAQACRKIEPFEIHLARFGFFAHSRRDATLYLVPEPAKPIKALHAALMELLPDCNDTARFAGGFAPHLSVGQARSREARALGAQLQAAWQPMGFTVNRVCLIWRNDPPDDLFRVGSEIPLGA